MEKPTKALLPIAVLLASTALNVQAATDSERIAALEAQLRQQQQAMQAMQAELQRLKADAAAEQASTTQVVPGPAQPVAAAPTATAKASTAEKKFSMTVYGFAQADTIYDFKRVDPDWADTLRVTTIPVDSGTFGNDGDYQFSVRQSRLGVQGEYGPDVTYKLEAELFGVGVDEGQTTIRLRHAWATYKDFGMGQTWSNFMDIDIFPNTVDYWGPTGMVFYRNKQARYTFPLASKNDTFAMSIENPDTALTVGQFRDADNCGLPNATPDCGQVQSTAEDIFQAYNDIPDLTARYRHDGGFGHAQVAGIVRKLGYERLDNGQDDYEIGWGINTTAGLKTWGSDMLKLQVAYGEGIGNYMNDGGVDIAPDSSDINAADAEAVPLWGLSAYYDHYWDKQWSTSIGWSMIDLDTTEGQSADEFKQGQIAQVNLLYYPVPHVLLGPEFVWGEREDVSGATGDDYRIQFTLKVDFDSGNLIR